ncbi:hypothetical protein [Streptomyces sp. DSM 15324]|uniref:hypothetical protein n=1 Tax=Streptomyces sp. DSM 15324 TaxID=1739111 RepID=UPI000749DF9D|nr:hypothetical protein [Streptomyces sp. DSM 15324]KUO11749.1 hypothetical protein AQJ58_11310 [Streptomyces sp. DSM 15324]
MSRETDSPSSGPNGRGGAAYPSGTPPYGIPVVSDAGADAGRSAARPEERKTETTLTTRIRINIPGSRPIPPVVVRKPVAESEGDDTNAGANADTGPQSRPAVGAGAGTDSGNSSGSAGSAGSAGSSGSAGFSGADTGSFAAPADTAAGVGEKAASDWFAPRKSGPAKGGQGGGATNGAGIPGGSVAGVGASGASGAPGASGASGTSGASGVSGTPAGGARPGAGRPAGGRPGGVVGSMSAPIGPRPGGTNGAGLPGATGGPVAPGHGGGTGSFDVTEALSAGPLGTPRPGQGQGQGQAQAQGQGQGPGQSPGGQSGGGAEARRDELPYFSGNGQGDQPGFPGTNGQGGAPGPGSRHDFNGPDIPAGPHGHGGPQGPTGPTGGPVTGDGPIVPPVAQGAAGPAVGAPGIPGIPGSPNGYGGAPGGPRTTAPGGPRTTVPGTARLPGGGLSDDTAVLTPQIQAPGPGAGGYGRPADNVSGHTVTSGIPVVPSADQGTPGAPGGTQSGGPGAKKAPKPAARAAQSASGSKKAKKKGRSKLVLLGGVLVLGGVGVYGAGLLMNHSDVPKGTTVLGVDIGGSTRDEAVKKLDDAFDKRAAQPLKLSVDGDTVSLKPDQAGLQFDIQATLDDAAKSDYNPVSVIGSLFGQHRVVEPEMPVDEEKLQAALQSVAGGAGSATDGTIKFESGKAIAVYGKAGKGIDAAKAEEAVVAGYRTQVETGATAPVTVPTTTKQPTITNAEVDRMMKEFAEPAMSGLVTVQTDAAHSIPFGPVSLPKILGVKAINGKLVETYNLQALEKAYGSTFDGVKVDGASGKRDILPQDVVAALRKALRGKTAAERVGVIDTNPN